MKMPHSGLATVFAMLIACCLAAQSTTPPLTITLKSNHAREVQTKEQLLRLAGTYDLSKWCITRTIHIEHGPQVVPHSHPVLTLNTRHLNDDELMLATFIHEQMHWLLDTLRTKQALYEEIKALFPHPPTAFPEGSGDSTGTWYHIVTCYLEYRGLVELLGELKAYQVIRFWQEDHYTWIYKAVWDNRRRLGALLRKYMAF